MGNARIIHIEETVFKGNTKKQNLFDRKISNNTTINHATIIRTEDDDIYGGELKDGKPHEVKDMATGEQKESDLNAWEIL